MLRHAFLILVVSTGPLKAQDLILTTSGDSIRCTIHNVGPHRLYFMVRDNGHVRRENIGLEQVAMYKREGYYPVIRGKDAVDVGARPTGRGKGRWMMTFAGGFSRRIAEIPDDLDAEFRDHLEAQLNGLHLMAALHYSIREEVALGIVYDGFFNAKHSMGITARTLDGTMVTGTFAEDARLRWIPFTLLYRPVSPSKTSFVGWLGVGPVFYTNHATIINKVTITGTTAAYGGSIGVDHRLSKLLSLGVHLTCMKGSINRFEVDFGSTKATVHLPENVSESVNRLDLGLVLRVRL